MCLPLFQVVDSVLVSVEVCLEFVEHLSREKIEVLLRNVSAQTGIKLIESANSFKMSGTFEQVDESRTMLKQVIHLYKSYGILVLNEEPEKVRNGRDDRRRGFVSRSDEY